MAERGPGVGRLSGAAPGLRNQKEKGTESQGNLGGKESTEAERGASAAHEVADPLRPSFGLEDDTVGPAADARTRNRKAGKATEAKDEPKASALLGDRKALAFVLDMIDAIMVARMGDAAKFTKAERDMIEPNAAKILARMSPKTVKTINGLTEPIAIMIGVSMYAMRLSALATKKAATENAAAPIQLRRETPATATFRPAPGPVPGSIPVSRPVDDRSGAPTAHPNGAVPKDGLGTVDDALTQMWGS